MAQQKETHVGKENIRIEKKNPEDSSHFQSLRTSDSPNLHCRLQRYMNKESSPIDIDNSNERHRGIDRTHNTTQLNYIDEHSMKMQKHTLQKGDIQNADLANVLPRISSSQTGASEGPAFTHSKPPKLPFLQEICQLKQKEMETKHKEKNYDDGSEKKRPTLNGLPFLNELTSIYKRQSTAFDRNNSEIKQDALNTMQASPTEQESDYVKQKIQNDIAKYNKKRSLMSPSPKSESFPENEKAIQKEKEAPVNLKNFVPPELPFLDEIHQLKRQEIEIVQYNKVQLPRENHINVHIGHIENRPKFGILPFLNDIKSLGQLKAKAERDIADTIAIPVTLSRSHNTEHESEYVQDKIQDDIAKYNQNRHLHSTSAYIDICCGKENLLNSCQRNSIIEQNEMSTIKKDLGVDIKRGSLSLPLPKIVPLENKKRNSLVPKVVRFADEDQENNSIPRKNSVEPSDIEDIEDTGSFPADTKATKPKMKNSTKHNIKIDEKTNMSKLSDQIIPQLNTMQKNFLGLLFFNELSPNIVEDIVAQQLSMMPGTKLSSVINNLGQQVCDTATPMMMEKASEEVRTALVCDAFGEFKAQEKAAVVFTTGNDAMDVCSTVADFGGRVFKKALIKNMIANRDKGIIDELIQEQVKDHSKVIPRGKVSLNSDHKYLHSEEEENYSSAEESIIDDGDENIHHYQYFDFEKN